MVGHWPHYAAAHHRLAVVNELLGQHHLVDGYYRAAAELAPRDVELLCDYGCSLYLREEYDAAAYQLGITLSESPSHARASTHLAMVQLRQGDLRKAQLSFRRAGCSDADASANIAFKLMLQEKWPQAAHYVQEALLHEPGSPLLQRRHLEIQLALAQAKHPNSSQTSELVGHGAEPPQTTPASYSNAARLTRQQR